METGHGTRTGDEPASATAVDAAGRDHEALLPEWTDTGVDDETWVAALEASRREQFAELAEL